MQTGAVNFVDALCFLETLVLAISYGLCWNIQNMTLFVGNGPCKGRDEYELVAVITSVTSSITDIIVDNRV